MLWGRSLVMKDLQTESLWSHILGEAMQGPLKGKVLDVLPGVVTTWEDWKNQYPQTTAFIMSRIPMDFQRQIIETQSLYVFGVRVGGIEKAYFYEFLNKNPIHNDKLSEIPVVISHHRKSAFTKIYSREIDNQIHEFESTANANHMRSKLDNSLWNIRTGLEIIKSDGDSESRQLLPLNGIISYAKAWKFFFPNTLYDDDLVVNQKTP